MKNQYKRHNPLRQIHSSEGVQLEKLRTRYEIERSMGLLRTNVQRTVLPEDTSLLKSPLKVVRFAAYGITAFKSFNAGKKLLALTKGRQL